MGMARGMEMVMGTLRPICQVAGMGTEMGMGMAGLRT